MTPPNVNTKGRATCDSQLLLPTNSVMFAVQRTGHNETKDRVDPSSSSLISNKIASSDAVSAVSDGVELLIFSKIQLVVYYQCCVLIG